MTHEPDDAIAKLEASMSNHMQAGDLAAAIECGTKVCRLREQHSGKDSLEYARSANNLGYLLYMTGDYGPAETLLQQAVDIRRELLAGQQQTQANTGMLFNIALNYGGRAEIVAAARHAIEAGVSPDELDEERSNEATTRRRGCSRCSGG